MKSNHQQTKHSQRIKLALFFCTLIFCSYGKADITKVSAAVGDWPPYISQNFKHYGVTAHIVTEAFAYEGVKVDYKFYPWKRSFTLAETGEADSTLPWLKTKEREEQFYISDSIIEQVVILMHRKDLNIKWTTWRDLQDYRIGATRGYVYGDGFELAESNGVINVSRTTSDEQNIKKLKYNRIDIFIVDRNVASSLMDKIYTEKDKKNFVFNEKPVGSLDTYYLISKKVKNGQEILKVFNRGLKKLRASGRYEEFIANSLKNEYEKKN